MIRSPHLIELVVCRHVKVPVTWSIVRLVGKDKARASTTEVEEDDFGLALLLAPVIISVRQPLKSCSSYRSASSIAPFTCSLHHSPLQVGSKHTAWLASGAGRMPSCLAKRMPASKHWPEGEGQLKEYSLTSPPSDGRQQPQALQAPVANVSGRAERIRMMP